MKTVGIGKAVGSFAEDKDVAAQIREKHVLPAVQGGGIVELDFTGVDLATQSFIHALIAQPLRVGGEKALKKIVFKGCSKPVRGIVETVVQYVLETEDEEDQKSGEDGAGNSHRAGQ
jgi:hypothetical protein